MPYLKGDNIEASNIHTLYQNSNDLQAFVTAARAFLSRERGSSRSPGMTGEATNAAPIRSSMPAMSPPRQLNQNSQSTPGRTSSQPVASPWGSKDIISAISNTPRAQPIPQTNDMESLERNMANLLSDDDDPIVSIPPYQNNGNMSAIGRGFGGFPTNPPGASILGSSPRQHYQQQPFLFQQQQSQNVLPITPPRGPSTGPPSNSVPTSSSPFLPSFSNPNAVNGNSQSPFANLQAKQQSYSPQRPAMGTSWGMNTPPGISNPATPAPNSTTKSPMLTPTPVKMEPTTIDTPTETPATKSRREYQPKRLWTHLEEQPGKVMANQVANVMGNVVDLRPRQELTAQWMLPLSYLRERAKEKGTGMEYRSLLANLAVGLFRRGCTENGAQASIVSKEILTPPGDTRSDYPFNVIDNNRVVGTVPFYSPRTPGHVVFRLYWQDEPLHTLATGPTLNVRVTENDFESAIRFILSNFKGKKVNPTSLSSINSFALVLEQFQVSQNDIPPGLQRQLEGAGRAVWGCICEARKVLDACATDYHKTMSKLEKLEESVEELKAKVEEAEKDVDKDDNEKESEEPTEDELELKEKLKTLLSGRASCERKWRDSQLAFSSILKAVVTNPNLTVVLRRELITKMRLEYELWCPLCEEFAIPGDSDAKMWYEPLSSLSHTVTAEHFRFCTEARSKMQLRILGFDPNKSRLDQILYPKRGPNRQMDPAAVNAFNQLSGAMGQLYQDVYVTADRIIQQREMIRSQTENFVNMCDCFPPGTKVAIFGSSANGYGSPKSDLDMCLQIPEGKLTTEEDDPTGSKYMAKLAQILEQNGMKDVDTGRLTARIPVIKFNCPKPLHSGGDDEEALMECDLSMHNPLAVLNTGLLRTYAEINPVSRVLASVIKQWAKAREINNPARHTLSSYGYILMLLHFLTFHQRSGDGLVSPVSKNAGRDRQLPGTPLLPNLQWMDASWPDQNTGTTSYREHQAMPKNPMKHPLEDRAMINMYFYRLTPVMRSNLQRLFPGHDLSLGILLASFFRYYAYEFDYKRHVVSLHSTITHGIVEREVKAELDGWRNYSAALTIEDPFERFYDVAHVLRGGYYHRIRREFAVAYSKIADVAAGKTSSTWNNKTVDLTTMNGASLIDWICEPIPNEKEETP